MTLDKWDELKEKIQSKFSVVDQGRETNPIPGSSGAEEIEYLIFFSPLGTLKASLITKPRVEGKKYLYSHRQNQSAVSQYEYSETEKVLRFVLEKETPQGWEVLDPEKFLS